ncbi:hypothetical protein JCM12294_32990 [Desulfocicer niacini]
MNTTLISEQNQTSNFDKMGIIYEHLSRLTVGTLLNRSGITKTKGATPLAIFSALFKLSFSRANLFQGIVKNKEIQVDKGAVYNFLNSSTYNLEAFYTSSFP